MAKSNYFLEYDDLGVRFIYPRNWSVETQTWDRGTYAISVDSPDGGFWALAIYPPEVDLDAEAKKALTDMKIEYDEVEEHKLVRYAADRALEGYELNFFLLDMTTTARAFKFRDDSRGYIVYWQTSEHMRLEDGEGGSFAQSDVFDVMTHTLISHLTGQEFDLWNEEELTDALSETELREVEDLFARRRRLELARLRQETEQWRRSEILDDGFSVFRVGDSSANDDVSPFLRDDDEFSDGEFDDDFSDDDDSDEFDSEEEEDEDDDV